MTTRTTRGEFAGYRKALRALAARLDRNLARDQRELLHADETDIPGGPMPATEAEENDGLHEVEVGLITNESKLLAEVTAALRRLDAGTFGRCEACRRAIARTRLDAVPYARECIRCAKLSPAVGG